MSDTPRFKCHVTGPLRDLVLQRDLAGDFVRAADYDRVAVALTAKECEVAILRNKAEETRKQLIRVKELLDKYPLDGFHRTAIEAIMRELS